MKNLSQASIVLILVMIIIVLASLFWFLYRDYDTAREQADLANSRATRVAAMEQEAGQIRVEADQIQATRIVIESELATAVFTQDLLAQEAVDDQQTIQALETRIASQGTPESIPEVIITAPTDGEMIQLADAVDLTIVAFDPNGISAINIVFDNNPSLEIPVGGDTSIVIQEPWPLSEAGEHTAVVTAVNTNNISSQVTTITITTENKRSREQIINEVANIIGLSQVETAPNTNAPLAQQSTNPALAATLETETILQAFDFENPSTTEGNLDWGIYCVPSASEPLNPQDIIDSPVEELALVATQVQEWQESQFQMSQLLAMAPHDDARAALCALAEGHKQWVIEEYINRAPIDQQTNLREQQAPISATERGDILSAQRLFGAEYGLSFFNALTANGGPSAVIEAWNQPPQSSSQILNPDKYEANMVPQSVQVPDLTDNLGDNWTPIAINVLGEFMLGQYLENFLDPTLVKTAVSGWQGDQYIIYQQGENGPILLTLQLNWASDQDALQFIAVYESYVNSRFENQAIEINSPETSVCWEHTTRETACIFTNNNQTTIITAPEENLAINTLVEIIERE